MKKTIILILVLSAFQMLAFSQESRTFLTLHGGFGNAKTKEAKLSSGFGIDFDFALAEKIHFNIMPTVNFRGYSGLVTTKPTFIDLPVCFEFSLDDNDKHMFIGFGGYYGIAVAGKFKNTLTVTGNTGWQKMTFGEEINDFQSKSDYGSLVTIGGYFPGYNGAIKAGIQIMTGFKNVVPEARHNDTIPNNDKLRNISLYMAFSIFNF